MLELIAVQKNIYRELRASNENQEKQLNLSFILKDAVQDLELQIRKLNAALIKNANLSSKAMLNVQANNSKGTSSTNTSKDAKAPAPAAPATLPITTELKSDTHSYSASSLPGYGIFAHELQQQNIPFDTMLQLIKARYALDDNQTKELRNYIFAEARRSPHNNPDTIAKSLYSLAMNANDYSEIKSLQSSGNDFAAANQLDTITGGALLDQTSDLFKVEPKAYSSLSEMMTNANALSTKSAAELGGYVNFLGTKAAEVGWQYQDIAAAFVNAEGKLSDREVSNALQAMMTERNSDNSKTKADYKNAQNLTDLLVQMNKHFSQKGLDTKQEQIGYIESIYGKEGEGGNKINNEAIRKLILDSTAMSQTRINIEKNKDIASNMAQAPSEGVSGSVLKAGNELDITKKELASWTAGPAKTAYDSLRIGMQTFQGSPDWLKTAVGIGVLGDSFMTTLNKLKEFGKGKLDTYTGLFKNKDNNGTPSASIEADVEIGGGNGGDGDKDCDCKCCCCDKKSDDIDRDKNNRGRAPHTRTALTTRIFELGNALFNSFQNKINPKSTPIGPQMNKGYDSLAQPDSLWNKAMGNFGSLGSLIPGIGAAGAIFGPQMLEQLNPGTSNTETTESSIDAAKWENITSGMSSLWNLAKDSGSNLWSRVTSSASSSVETPEPPPDTSFWGSLQSDVSNAWSSATSAASSVVDDIQSRASDALTWAANEGAAAWEGIQSRASEALTWASNTGTAAWNDIQSGASYFWAGTVDNWNGLKDSFNRNMELQGKGHLLRAEGMMAASKSIGDVLTSPDTWKSLNAGVAAAALGYLTYVKVPNPLTGPALAALAVTTGIGLLTPEEASAAPSDVASSTAPTVTTVPSTSAVPSFTDDNLQKLSLWNRFVPNMSTGVGPSNTQPGFGIGTTMPLSTPRPVNSTVQANSNANINLNVTGFVDQAMINKIRDVTKQEFDSLFSSLNRSFLDKVQQPTTQPTTPSVHGRGGVMPY